MIQFIMISLLTASGSSHNSLIRAFEDNKHNGNDRCQPVIRNAWQCWSKFGNHYMCSDTIRQAWQCFLSKSKYGRRRVKSDWKKPRRSQKPGKHLLQSLLPSFSTTSTTTTPTTSTSSTTIDTGIVRGSLDVEPLNWLAVIFSGFQWMELPVSGCQWMSVDVSGS